MNSPLLELFYYPECPFCMRVLNEVDRLAIKVEYKHIFESSENMNRLQAETGKRTVPCLYIDNNPMHESSDIIQWLNQNKEHLTKKMNTN